MQGKMQEVQAELAEREGEASGVQKAIEEGRKVMEEEMGKVTGGLGQMPGGLF